MSRKSFAEGVGCLAMIILAVVILKWGERIKDLFRLSGEDTVYEYHTARVEKQVDFLMRMCNNGDCLTRVDWECGFSLEHEKEIHDCFEAIAHEAKPWVRLDAIRKLCGKQFAKFTGELYGNPKECEKLGGRWGEKLPGPVIDY